jgi:DUF2971 family protein
MSESSMSIGQPSDPMSTAAINFVKSEWIGGILSDPLPDLFHYTNAEGLKGIVESQTLWASHISFMNDPMEMKYAVNLCRKVLDESTRSSEDSVDELLHATVKTGLDRIGDLLTGFVFCFCEKDDLLSQWRGYGDTSSAFSIGIDVNSLGIMTLARGDIRKVIYDVRQQEKMLQRLLSDWRNVLELLVKDDLVDYRRLHTLNIGFVMAFAPVALSMKVPAFAEECEWRMITIRMNTSELYPTRLRDGKLVPYLEISETNTDGKSLNLPIKSLRVGPTSDVERDLNAVRNLLHSNGIMIEPISSAFQLKP